MHVGRGCVVFVERVFVVHVRRGKQLAGREAQELQDRDDATQNHALRLGGFG
jgi:hypothetical protein